MGEDWWKPVANEVRPAEMSRCIKPELRPQKDHFKVSTTFQLPFIGFLRRGEEVCVDEKQNRSDAGLCPDRRIDTVVQSSGTFRCGVHGWKEGLSYPMNPVQTFRGLNFGYRLVHVET